jgi:hypothetical protein
MVMGIINARIARWPRPKDSFAEVDTGVIVGQGHSGDSPNEDSPRDSRSTQNASDAPEALATRE